MGCMPHRSCPFALSSTYTSGTFIHECCIVDSFLWADGHHPMLYCQEFCVRRHGLATTTCAIERRLSEPLKQHMDCICYFLMEIVGGPQHPQAPPNAHSKTAFLPLAVR